MPRFHYIVSSSDGKILKGEAKASSKEEVIETLKQEGFFIVSVREKKKVSKMLSLSFLIDKLSRTSKFQIVVLARNLSIMLKAGLTINESLSTLRDEGTSRKMKRVLTDLLHSVESGNPFSYALSLYPNIFSSFFVNVVKTGEESGTLVENLEYISSQLKKEYELARKIKGAMLYPFIVIGTTVGVGITLAILVLPRIVGLFTTLRIPLPLITVIFIKIVVFLQNNFIALFVGLVIFIITLMVVSRMKSIKPFFHNIVLHLPIVGPISHNVNIIYFSRTLGMLIKSGVPIMRALEITADTVRNEIYRRKLMDLLPKIKRGNKLSDMLKGNPRLFPVTLTKIINVGERTGNLDESLLFLAGIFEDEVNEATKSLAMIVEPLLLIFVGFAVAGVAIAIIIPIYQLTGSFNP